MSAACRLYLVTPPDPGDPSAFADVLARALDAGDVACVQLRIKPQGAPARDAAVLRAAEILSPVARSRDVAFLINDRPDLAKSAGADGVHVGQSDVSVREARALLGESASIGVTCHASRHLALIAGEDGADYVAFGAFYPTATKETAHRAEPEILEWWRHATTLPCVAIGGVTPQNCAPLVRAGADFLAVSAAVWGHQQGPTAAIREFEAAIALALQG